MYYPVLGMLRGRLVSDEHRTTVGSSFFPIVSFADHHRQISALFRIPLNIFVLVALLTGVASARLLVLTVCGIILLCTAVITFLILVRSAQVPQAQYEAIPGS